MAVKKRNKRFLIIILLLLIVFSVFGVKYSMNYINKTVYKTNYSEIIDTYSTKYGVDKYLIYAVIKTESNFDKNAVSNVGARGLMQMMTDTFNWVGTKLKDNDTTYDDMFIPEDNIRYGAYLLDYLVDEFDNYEAALAAYHAGRGAVNGWLKNEKYSNDGKTLNSTPIKDTNHYIKKVMKNYNMYCKLYK